MNQNNLKAYPGLTVLVVLILAGCVPAGGASNGNSIADQLQLNVVEAATLQDTVSIEIDEFLVGGTEMSEHKFIVVISDPDVVMEIVSALDIALPLKPRAQCLERYRLRFILSDETVQEFGYSCGASGDFLRGAQEFWRFQDVSPPDAFKRLIAEQISNAIENHR